MPNDLLSMGISVAGILARMAEVRATKRRGLDVVVHDSSAVRTVKTLDEVCVLVATKICR